jgi:hypothetical protein
MKYMPIFISLFIHTCCIGQQFDTSRYRISVEIPDKANDFFAHDHFWRGADGASSIDLENGKILWLFSDSFIALDSSMSRKKSRFIRNSIAIQEGYDIQTATIEFYWNKKHKKKPLAFFHQPGKSWYWTGHGTRIEDKLILFLMKVRSIKTGLGFEIFGWAAVLITNPDKDPSDWKMQYLDGVDTYGFIAGSAAVVKDERYLYAFGAVEPATHEAYVLRWDLNKVHAGNLTSPEWWIKDRWMPRTSESIVPEPLFIGGTEYSIHYDTALRQFIQIQSFGFGEASLGIRMSDSLTGKWTDPHLFFRPEYPGVKKPFMYAAKAHPELKGSGVYITYNVNSFDLGELIDNQAIYFPVFVEMKIEKK